MRSRAILAPVQESDAIGDVSAIRAESIAGSSLWRGGAFAVIASRRRSTFPPCGGRCRCEATTDEGIARSAMASYVQPNAAQLRSMTEDIPRSLLRRFAREQRARVLRLSSELVIASTELAVARIRDAMTRIEADWAKPSRCARPTPSSVVASQRHLLPRGEKGERLQARRSTGSHYQATDGSPAPSAAPGLPSIVVVVVVVLVAPMILMMVMMMRILRQFHRALNGRGV
jgi:hypothetical protein